MRIFRLTALIILISLMSITIFAQNSSNTQPASGVVPDATFSASFAKFTPPENVFSPFVAWDAKIGMDTTVFRIRRHEVDFKFELQTIGTRNRNSKINIAGNSYFIETRYAYAFSKNAKVSFGIRHLSSHETQDLLKVVKEERSRGTIIPQIDTSDLNIFFVEGFKRFERCPFEPEVRLRIQALGFRFRGGKYVYNKPVYLMTQITAWHGHEKRLVVGTQNEFGNNGFKEIYSRLELYAKNQREGRLQLLVSYSPGKGLHVSPNDGWHRDGLNVGIRLVFQAH